MVVCFDVFCIGGMSGCEGCGCVFLDVGVFVFCGDEIVMGEDLGVLCFCEVWVCYVLGSVLVGFCLGFGVNVLLIFFSVLVSLFGMI